MLTAIVILLILALLYVLSLCCRTGHRGLKALQGWRYAHRGLHNDTRPENSMSAFRAALENGYGIELDIHLLADGNLAVMHDASLKRTADADVLIEDLTTEQLAAYRLNGSGETIPLFQEVLDLFAGKAPLIVELKAEKNNHAALCEAACKMLDGYNGPFCIESFDPRCVLWLKKHRPDIIRGQLARNFLKTDYSVPWILKFALTHQLLNFLLLPDFVAYRFHDRKNLGNFLVKKLWGVQPVSWTLRAPEELVAAEKEGYLGIFEGFTP